MGKYFAIIEGVMDIWNNALRNSEIGDNNLQPLRTAERILLERGPVKVALRHPSLKERRKAEQERKVAE